MFGKQAACVMLAFLFLSCGREDSVPSQADAVVKAQAVSRSFADGAGGARVGEAIDAILATGERALREAGKADVADKLDADWKLRREYLLAPLMVNFAQGKHVQDMGDHDPLSQWLAEAYAILEAALGHQTCVLLHLTDIFVLNFSIPVAFHPEASERWCFETTRNNPKDDCKSEYRRHVAGTNWQINPDPFAKQPLHDGLLPVVTYWIVWGACEAATMGTGWFLVCSPIGNLIEVIDERYIAPGVSDQIYQSANGG